jgi:hypothetical protein
LLKIENNYGYKCNLLFDNKINLIHFYAKIVTRDEDGGCPVISYNKLLLKELVMAGIQNIGWNFGVARVPSWSLFLAYLNNCPIKRRLQLEKWVREDGR